jgi:hypothetical protein
MINFNTRAEILNDSTFEGYASSKDSMAFENSIGGGSNLGLNSAARAGEWGAREMSKASKEVIERRVIDQKNSMIIEAIGSAAKKAVETADKIKF